MVLARPVVPSTTSSARRISRVRVQEDSRQPRPSPRHIVRPQPTRPQKKRSGALLPLTRNMRLRLLLVLRPLHSLRRHNETAEEEKRGSNERNAIACYTEAQGPSVPPKDYKEDDLPPYQEPGL